jgi:hypothetical protein
MNVREVISIFYPDSKAKLGELLVDAFIHETHTFSSEITEHPIESGSVIGDHVYNMPFCLAIDGIISNTPMSLVGLTAFDSAVRFIEGESNDIVVRAFETIKDLFRKRAPLSIATSLKTYHKMVLENLSIERGGGFYSESLHFSCTAKQIRFAHQELIKIPEPKTSRCKPKQKKGLQETKPLSPEKVESIKEKTDKTWLKSIFGSISLGPGNIK